VGVGGPRGGQIVFGLTWEPFEPAHGVVAEISDRAARERRQPRRVDRFVLAHQIAHYVQHRGDELLAGDAGAFDGDLGPVAKIAGDVARPNYGVRRAAEERIARDFLAALYRFEQEGMRRLALDAQVGRDGRQQIGHHRLDQRHDRPTPGHRQKLFVGCRCDCGHILRVRERESEGAGEGESGRT